MTGTDGDFGEIRLRGPWTLADAIYEVSAPLVSGSLFGPVDFGELKSQEVDSGNLQRKTDYGTATVRKRTDAETRFRNDWDNSYVGRAFVPAADFQVGSPEIVLISDPCRD